MPEILLATDLDGTLIGDKTALQQLNAYLSNLRTQNKLKLAYVTGRSFQLYKELEVEESLLTPDVLVTGVGTEIYWNNSELADDWPLVEGWDRDSIQKSLEAIEELEPQPESEQRKYKLSYFLKQNPDALHRINKALDNFDLNVLYSHELYLDILPKGIHKGSALKYLANKWGIPTDNIIACGDSANDIAMLEVNKGVIVGNARQELLDWANAQGTSGNLYLAKSQYAAGILEGLKHFQEII